MGGGAAVRAAAKVSGIGVVEAGVLGGLSSVPRPAEHSVRNVSRPVTALISQGGKAGGGDLAAAVHRPSCEFAGAEEELLLDTGRPMSRVVFGGAPSLQEAKDATTELKDAPDKVHLSSPTHKGSDGSSRIGQLSALSSLTNSDNLKNKKCITSEPIAAPVPKYAMKAFSLLQESPAAQTVVTSIADDPNVLDAVRKNNVFTEFLRTHKMNLDLGDQESSSECTEVSDNECQVATGKSVKGLGGFLVNIKQRVVEMVSNVSAYLQNLSDIKRRVVEMVSNVSTYLQNLSDALSAEKAAAASGARPNSMDKTLGASFMALAVMVIMVVLKRV